MRTEEQIRKRIALLDKLYAMYNWNPDKSYITGSIKNSLDQLNWMLGDNIESNLEEYLKALEFEDNFKV